MYVSYFDDSGDERSIFVSGWASTAEKWLVFEKEWSEYLDCYGLKYFHMKEFSKDGKLAHTWGDDSQRYCAFLQGCAAIIKRHVNFGVSRGIFLNEYDAANRECGVKFKIGPAFSACAVLSACRAQKRGVSAGFEGDDVRHHFDNPGKNKGKPELYKLFEQFGLPSDPQFEKGEKKKKPKPLQAADFIAWEHRFVINRYSEFGPLNPDQIHRSLRHLNSIPNDSQMLKGKDNIIAFCRNPQGLC